jgi:hypothetical protein
MSQDAYVKERAPSIYKGAFDSSSGSSNNISEGSRCVPKAPINPQGDQGALSIKGTPSQMPSTAPRAGSFESTPDPRPVSGAAWTLALAQRERARTQPPSNVTARRWGFFNKDADRFVKGWLTQAKALGWHPSAILGFAGNEPVDHIAREALLWQGGDWTWWHAGIQIIAMTAETATIRTPGGNTETYHKLPSGHGVIQVAPTKNRA